jgi:nicotinic acid mononucleotide adenylyltransferase
MNQSTAPAIPFPYDLPRLLWLRERIRSLGDKTEPALDVLHAPAAAPRRVGILAGSFNPLTHGHVALVEAAEADAVVLVLPLRAVDKEGVTRAAAEDRALVLLEWARCRDRVGVALVNRGLYVEQAALLAAHYPGSELSFLTGHDKIVQIFDPRYYAERDTALRELFRLARFHVAPRAGRGTEALHALLDEPQNRAFAAAVTALALGEDVDALSSTLVREAAGTGKPWEDMVPEETALFMREALPYTPPTRLPDGEEIDAYGLRLALIAAAAAGRLDPAASFMELCRTARDATVEGRRLRAMLAQDCPTRRQG